jgi:hypothetical protein
LGALVGLMGVMLSVSIAAQAQGAAATSNGYSFKKVPFDELSERSVSRQGDAALKLATVKWEHSESDHFIFHTESGFAVTQLVSVAEWSYAAIKKDLQITQDTFERKCHIYVFLNEPVWREFVSSGKLEPWTGGWCTGRELFFASRPNFRFQGTTLPHEMTHLVLHRFVGGDIPLWLNEGLAEFEGIRTYRTYLKTRNYTLTNVRDYVDADQFIPLKNLTSAIDYPKTKEEVTTFYVESERLISFLYFRYGGTGPLMKFLKLQSEGARFDSTWREAYGREHGDQQAFEDRFVTYVTKAKQPEGP